MIYNVVLVSAAQQSVSVIHIHIDSRFNCVLCSLSELVCACVSVHSRSFPPIEIILRFFSCNSQCILEASLVSPLSFITSVEPSADGMDQP